MRRHARNGLAALLCACLLMTPVTAGAASVEASVGDPAPFVEEQATTTVSVMTVGLSIAGKTHDVTASVGDILKDDGVDPDERTYVLKVVLSGADPADCSFTWTRGVVAADGTVQPDPAFFDARAEHPLVDDAQAGLLQTGSTYHYTVDVSDDASGQSASASIDVTISDDYLDRMLAHASGVTVSGALLRSLADGDLSVEALDPASPTYGFLQQAAEGRDIKSAWRVELATPSGAEPFIGFVEVALPIGLPDGTVVAVVALGADGRPAVFESSVQQGRAVVEVSALGAFAVAVQPAKTYTVTAEAGEGGSVSPAGEKTYAEGAEPVYTFLPDEGHVLDVVEVDGKAVEVQGNSYRFAPLANDHRLRALFKAVEPTVEEHAVTARVAGGQGRVSIDGADPSTEQAKQVRHGASAVVRFVPDDGFTLDVVTVAKGGGEPVRVEVTGDSLALSAVEADTVVEATFRAGSTPPIVTHELTASVAFGRGSVSPERVTVEHGGSATFTFVPEAGWRIASVTLDGADVSSQVAGGALKVQNVVADHMILVGFERAATDPVDGFVTVEASAGAGGAVSPEGSVVLPKGGSQTFYFLPDVGKKVASLTVDGKTRAFSGTSYTLFGVERDASIRVEFADAGSDTPAVPVTHEVRATAGEGGAVHPAGTTRVVDGGALLLAFVPEPGYEVDEVSVDGRVVQKGGTSYRLVDVRADMQAEVSFKRSAEPDEPLVGVEVKVEAHADGGEGGSVSPSGTLSMVRGSSQTFHVFPEQGYDLDRVTVNGEEVQAQPLGALTLRAARMAAGVHGGYRFTVDNVSDDTEVRVAFRKLGEGEPAPAPVLAHEVTAPATEGGLISPAGTTLVADGGSLSFTVKSNEGYRLASLSVDGRDMTSLVQGGTFLLEDVFEDAVVRATFERIPDEPDAPAFATVRATAGAGGIVSPSGEVRVPRGGSQTFAFVPDEGFVLERVTVDGREVVPIDGVYTMFDVAADARIHAEFRPRTASDPEPVLPDMRTVTATAGEGGTVEPSGEVRVATGSSVAFAFTPDEGFELDRVTLDGEDTTDQVEDGMFVLYNVEEDHALVATFARIGSDEPDPPAPPAATYTVTARVEGGHGSVSPAGAVTVAEGADQSFSFLPDAGYAVGAVWVDGVRLTWSPHNWTFPNVHANHELTVSFRPAPAPAPGPGTRPSNPVEAVGEAVSNLTRTGDAPWALAAGVLAATALGIAMVARGCGRRAGVKPTSDRR